MLKSRIFLNKNKLSPRYIPKILPHREDQIKLLFSLFEDALEQIEGTYLRVSQIIGGVGTGKTCTAIRFGNRLQEEAFNRKIRLIHVYLNCKLEGASRFILYKSLLEKAAPEISTRSLSPEEMLQQLMKYLQNEDRYLVVSVDEIDYFCKRSKESVVYDLTRLNEIYPGQPSHVVGVIFISRDLSFHEHLEPSERSTLGKGLVEFPNYTSKQIKDILAQRVEEAFRPGAVDEEILDFIGSVTATPSINGDVRVALDLLLYSGMLAENQGYDRVSPEHVRRVYGETYPRITTEDVLNLDETGKMVLLGVARSLETKDSPYVSLPDIRQAYRIVCEEYGVKPVEEIEEYLQDLCDREIVDMKSLTKFGISDVSAKDLRRFLNGIMERVKHGLHKA